MKDVLSVVTVGKVFSGLVLGFEGCSEKQMP